MTDRLLFDTGCPGLASRLAGQANVQVGDLKQVCFADFEVYHQFRTPVERREVLIVGDLTSDSGFLRLYDTASCAFDEDALSITLVAQETPDETPFEKRCRLRAFGAIPLAPRGNRMALVNPASAATPTYERLKPATVRRRNGTAALELACADAPTLVFSISSYDYLAERMLAAGGKAFEKGEVKRSDRPASKPSDIERKLLASRFQNKDNSVSETELARLSAEHDDCPTEVGHPLSARQPFTKLVTPVAGRHVVIIAGTVNDPDTMDLFRLANAVYEGGALSLTMVVPYFAYSTMERKSKTGEAVKAKIRSRLLSSIPRCPMGNKIVLCDLHNEAMPGCFEMGLKPIHLYCGKVVVARLAGESKDWNLASADINRIKWVESMAGDAGVDTAYTLKVRKDGVTRQVGFVGDVTGKLVRMFDDMVRTGGSAIGAGKGYLERQAKAVEMTFSHCVAPDGAAEKMRKSGAFTGLICTDSHPRAVQLAASMPDYVRVESIAEIIVDQLTGRGFFATRTLS